MIKLKAIIYKYTGLYLAHREELEYITSDECWKFLTKIAKNKKNDMTAKTAQGLSIGLWQADNGFARPMSIFFRLTYSSNPYKQAVFKTLNWFATLALVVKWDIQRLLKR